MIKKTLNDKTYQSLQDDLATLQVNQMIDGAFRFEEEKQIKDKIKARYDQLKREP